MTYHFPKKILGSCISLTYKNLTINSEEIIRSFENWAPEWDKPVVDWQWCTVWPELRHHLHTGGRHCRPTHYSTSLLHWNNSHHERYQHL